MDYIIRNHHIERKREIQRARNILGDQVREKETDKPSTVVGDAVVLRAAFAAVRLSAVPNRLFLSAVSQVFAEKYLPINIAKRKYKIKLTELSLLFFIFLLFFYFFVY